MRPPTIEVTIEKLVLHGFDRRSGDALAQGFTAALERLIEESHPGWPGGGRGVGRLDAGSVVLPTHADPQEVGAAIARAVHGGLWR